MILFLLISILIEKINNKQTKKFLKHFVFTKTIDLSMDLVCNPY